MFESIVLHGTKGAILLGGYSPAASVRAWKIRHHRPDAKHSGRWTLTATLEQVNKFSIRQRPLVFAAPRERGFWYWPLVSSTIQVGDSQLFATLEKPER